ncbi:Phage baseplate [Candidatus Burkholderia pumila]|uniref:Phage baseplate n=1 Tax=Candidatus Burkholderia pumila TaxID=1090375 RepID=A0ABR5HLT5_9BURK|nr:Phage baseplate [Candidatus Burkholderia pumila]
MAWIALWLKDLVLQAIALTRSTRSNGADLDSWFAQLDFQRLAPAAASGTVTFSRFTASAAALIPVGAIVQTGDGSQHYQVSADTSNASFDAGQNGYVILSRQQSVVCPVICITPGSNSLNLPYASGNVSAGTVNTLYQSIPFVDTVTNAPPFVNGETAEIDAVARERFVAYPASLTRATRAARSVLPLRRSARISPTIIENKTKAGEPQMGYFHVIVDDSTGAPSATVISTVDGAVDAVRLFTSTFGVFAPTVVNASVAMALQTYSTGLAHATTCALVQQAVLAYTNALPLGASLPYFKLAQIALDTSADVASVQSLTVNGAKADLTVTNQQVIKSTSVSVS